MTSTIICNSLERETRKKSKVRNVNCRYINRRHSNHRAIQKDHHSIFPTIMLCLQRDCLSIFASLQIRPEAHRHRDIEGVPTAHPSTSNKNRLTHLLSCQKRIALEFTRLDNNSVGHGEIYKSIVDCNKVQCPLQLGYHCYIR